MSRGILTKLFGIFLASFLTSVTLGRALTPQGPGGGGPPAAKTCDGSVGTYMIGASYTPGGGPASGQYQVTLKCDDSGDSSCVFCIRMQLLRMTIDQNGNTVFATVPAYAPNEAADSLSCDDERINPIVNSTFPNLDPGIYRFNVFVFFGPCNEFNVFAEILRLEFVVPE